MANDLTAIERQLNDFDPDKRREALGTPAGATPDANSTGRVNVHLHTFFSFNADGWSPSRIVWEAKKSGLDVVGSVDFDVLDAMPEMFDAGELLSIPTVASLETRVFIPDEPEKEFCSPGEPGVAYFMGAGFTRLPEQQTPARAFLDGMRRRARDRNIAMLKRLAPTISPLKLDYEKDVVSLTPSGNATERHMLAALETAAREKFSQRNELTDFWARRIGLPLDEVAAILDDRPALRKTIRAKLMKRGGTGYVRPDETTFPPVDDVIRMILECEAIPCYTWLDGTSEGEADPDKLLDFWLDKHCLALNIIPDRNWNISDPETKELKTRKLADIVRAATERDLILLAGTEKNSHGQRFIDDFDAPELNPFKGVFRDGALTLYGHTLLQRAQGKGRTSNWARQTFGDDRKAANEFYLAVGMATEKPRAARETLEKLSQDCSADDIRRTLE